MPPSDEDYDEPEFVTVVVLDEHGREQLLVLPVVPPPPEDRTWEDRIAAEMEAEAREERKERRRAQRERRQGRKARIRAMAANGDAAGYRALVAELEGYWTMKRMERGVTAHRLRELGWAERAQTRSVARTWRDAVMVR